MGELKRQLDQKTAQLSALREIGQAINAAWELQATLDLITRKTAAVMGMDSCSIYLLDENEAFLTLEATTGLAPDSIGRARLRLGEGLTGWAAQRGQPVAVADAACDPRFKHLPETEESIFQSLLAVPLSNQGRVIGAMNVQTEQYHRYGNEEIELLSLIGDLAAGALEKAMLYDQMQRQISELSTLAEVSETITSPLYLDQMLNMVVGMAAQVMRARATSLLLLNEQDELIIHATHNLSPAYCDKSPLKLGRGITGRVAQSGQPMAVKDVRQEKRYRYPEIAVQEGLYALLCVPLQVRERVIGVLNSYTGRPYAFSPQEIELLQTLANQTALAIENARLAVNTAVVREMHHRVKNNLQTIAMLLRLQLGEPDIDAEEALRESIDRILSIAAVHEMLSEKGFRMVDVKQVFEQVTQTVLQHRLHLQKSLQVSVQGDEVALPSREATALTLAVNELVQNALKHAFADQDAGRITVTLNRQASDLTVVVKDDGIGLSARERNPDDQPSLGLQIIETLVTQDLGGELTIEQSEEGTCATITIQDITAQLKD
jgi:signal transduction protein with GAF and PtsI domain/anti-sigma regulatory factor (Ser/Thr protein kinase)